MDSEDEVAKKIDELAIGLAKTIVDSSHSVEGAHRLFVQAFQLLEVRTRLGMLAPAFQGRVTAARKRERERMEAACQFDAKNALVKIGFKIDEVDKKGNSHDGVA